MNERNERMIELFLRKEYRDGVFDPSLDDATLEHIISTIEPAELSEELKHSIPSRIREGIAKRNIFLRMDLKSIGTFGELILKLKEYFILSLGIKELHKLTISLENNFALNSIESNHLTKVSIKDISRVIVFFGIDYQQAIALLKNSFRIEQLREKQLMSFSNARIDQNPDDEARRKASQSIMQKLMLQIDEKKKLTDIELTWNSFKVQLDNELKNVNYI